MNRAARRARGHRGKAARRPSIGLALIARDEEASIPNLLESVTGCFDLVVLVDTGSTDATVQVFEDWARRAGQRYVVDGFEWIDDFAAARNHAQDLLNTDWTCWSDCDDTIQGAANLRRLAAEAHPDVLGFDFHYDYEGGTRRSRLIRCGRSRWAGRVHEIAVPLVSDLANAHRYFIDVDRDVCFWQHRAPTQRERLASLVRNLRIYEQWLRDEPDHPLIEHIGQTSGLEALRTARTWEDVRAAVQVR